MPEFTAVQIAIPAALLLVGAVLGWFFRSDRCAREKIAINAGWQEQVETRQAENDRLADQNKSLMQQVSEYQASQHDSTRRARELSATLKEALERRDELQRQIKDIRGSLEAAIEQRSRLERDFQSLDERGKAEAAALKEKDNKIFKLSRELSSWQSRVPPLVEKFRQRDLEAKQLQLELDKATDRIVELEVMMRPDETRVEPVDRESLGLRLDASNDQYDEASEQDIAGLQDQVDHYCSPITNPVTSPGTGGGRAGEQKPPRHSPDGAALSVQDVFAYAGDRPTGSRDDLQQIKGVGPAIEKTLNDLGIFRFEQIAGISEFDIDRIAKRLKGLRSRIYREDWIGQARTLQYQKDRDGVH